MGQTVAANAGSSAIPSWEAYSAANGGPAPDVVEFDDKLAAMQALRDGAVEGYTEDNITMLSLAAGDPNLELLPAATIRCNLASAYRLTTHCGAIRSTTLCRNCGKMAPSLRFTNAGLKARIVFSTCRWLAKWKFGRS